mmetsp:Transcript_14054/g.36361  ORF Transcript_14054/g.36361 Transcript_14054/m.36361 type:complete len:92 (-) Transcript_14054:386-661(-)
MQPSSLSLRHPPVLPSIPVRRSPASGLPLSRGIRLTSLHGTPAGSLQPPLRSHVSPSSEPPTNTADVHLPHRNAVTILPNSVLQLAASTSK